MKDIAKLTERVAGTMKTAGSAQISADGIKKAMRALLGLPIEYAWPDKKKGAGAKRKLYEAEQILEDILVDLPVVVDYQVVGLGSNVFETNDPNKLVDFMKKHGKRMSGYSDSRGRKWLRDQPKFMDMAGPMSNGPNKVRYETWEANEMLSR